MNLKRHARPLKVEPRNKSSQKALAAKSTAKQRARIAASGMLLAAYGELMAFAAAAA